MKKALEMTRKCTILVAPLCLCILITVNLPVRGRRHHKGKHIDNARENRINLRPSDYYEFSNQKWNTRYRNGVQRRSNLKTANYYNDHERYIRAHGRVSYNRRRKIHSYRTGHRRYHIHRFKRRSRHVGAVQRPTYRRKYRTKYRRHKRRRRIHRRHRIQTFRRYFRGRSHIRRRRKHTVTYSYKSRYNNRRQRSFGERGIISTTKYRTQLALRRRKQIPQQHWISFRIRPSITSHGKRGIISRQSSLSKRLSSQRKMRKGRIYSSMPDSKRKLIIFGQNDIKSSRRRRKILTNHNRQQIRSPLKKRIIFPRRRYKTRWTKKRRHFRVRKRKHRRRKHRRYRIHNHRKHHRNHDRSFIYRTRYIHMRSHYFYRTPRTDIRYTGKRTLPKYPYRQITTEQYRHSRRFVSRRYRNSRKFTAKRRRHFRHFTTRRHRRFRQFKIRYTPSRQFKARRYRRFRLFKRRYTPSQQFKRSRYRQFKTRRYRRYRQFKRRYTPSRQFKTSRHRQFKTRRYRRFRQIKRRYTPSRQFKIRRYRRYQQFTRHYTPSRQFNKSRHRQFRTKRHRQFKTRRYRRFQQFTSQYTHSRQFKGKRYKPDRQFTKIRSKNSRQFTTRRYTLPYSWFSKNNSKSNIHGSAGKSRQSFKNGGKGIKHVLHPSLKETKFAFNKFESNIGKVKHKRKDHRENSNSVAKPERLSIMGITVGATPVHSKRLGIKRYSQQRGIRRSQGANLSRDRMMGFSPPAAMTTKA